MMYAEVRIVGSSQPRKLFSVSLTPSAISSAASMPAKARNSLVRKNGFVSLYGRRP